MWGYLSSINPPVLPSQSQNTSSKAFTDCPASFFFKKIFERGGVICGKFVRCKVKGSDGPHAVPYGRDNIQEKFKKIIPLWGPASCGYRNRGGKSHSLSFFCPCKCPMASEGSMQAFACPVSFSFKKFFRRGGCDLRIICPLLGEGEQKILTFCLYIQKFLGQYRSVRVI